MKECDEKIEKYVNDHSELKEKMDNLKKIIDEHKEKRISYEIYDLIYKSIRADDGIYNTLLYKNALPGIEKMLNKMLVIFDGMYEVELKLDKKGLHIVKKNSNIQLASFSTSEKSLFNLVFRVVLSALSKNGHNFYIMDECFENFDENHKLQTESLLVEMKKHFKWIWVVSHDTRIKNICDININIKKDKKGFSYIVDK